ncbi:MAG: hypothetical protein ABFD79_16280 [Phycisphaerales bacterium]
MNIRQKKLVANIITVAFFTTVMIVGFANIKNSINRSESLRAMNLLSKEIFRYRETYGSLPNESFIRDYIENTGIVRIGDLQYRAAWIEYNSEPNSTVLAYSKKTYSGLVKSGYVVLWLDGRIEWMKEKEFDKILSEQQKKQELQWIQEHLKKESDF